MAENSAAEPYRSLPLPSVSKCIRVLDIRTASDATAAVVADLRVVDLASSPKFTALSYVWSSPEPNRIITCNGMDVVISANGHSALRHLWTTLGAFTIWIDGICIDQANALEKEHQIPLMGDIYSRATSVYIWLGEGSKRSDRAMDHLRTAGLFYCYDAETNIDKIGHLRPFLAACSTVLAGYSLTRHPFPFIGPPGTLSGPLSPIVVRLWNGNTNYATIEDIERLLDRKWITRLWTYQEILLAMNPIVVCGNSHVHWDRFTMGLIFLEMTTPCLGSSIRPWKRVALGRQNTTPESVSSSPGRESSLEAYAEFSRRVCRFHRPIYLANLGFLGMMVVSQLFVLLALLVMDNGPLPEQSTVRILLSVGILVTIVPFLRSMHMNVDIERQSERNQIVVDDLIDGTYNRKATESKDMAFGLWAILQRRTRLPLPKVDYTESKENIYASFSRLLVQITGSPHLLLVAAINNMEGQPSWVPDWASKQKRACDWGDIAELIHRNEGSSHLKRIQWDTVSISMVNQHAVSVWGRTRGTVAATFVFQKTQFPYQQADSCKHIYNMGRMMEIYKDFEISLNSLRSRSTVLLDLTHDQEVLWSRFLCEHRGEEPLAVLRLLCDVSSRRGFRQYATLASGILKTHTTVCNALAQDGRMLFRGEQLLWEDEFTHSSPILGECRRNVEAGDHIVEFPGVQLPLIVRLSSRAGNNVQIKSIAYTSSGLWTDGNPSSGFLAEWRVGLALQEFHVY